MTLKDCKLFAKIEPTKIEPLLAELHAVRKRYRGGQTVLAQGEKTDRLGIVESGSIDALHYGPDGNVSLVAHHSEGKIFADFLAATGTKESPVTVCASGDCVIVFIPMAGLFLPLKRYETEGRRLLANLAFIYAEEYFVLKDRIYCLTGTNLREKIMRLLTVYQKKAGKPNFHLPYGRDRMAAELNADRSALCRELSRMKADGLIEYKGNSFTLNNS